MMGNYYFYAVIAVVTIVIAYSMVLTFAALVGNHLHANAINSTVAYNSTSTICVDDRPCVTTHQILQTWIIPLIARSMR